jgi:hypothetical protein
LRLPRQVRAPAYRPRPCFMPETRQPYSDRSTTWAPDLSAAPARLPRDLSGTHAPTLHRPQTIARTTAQVWIAAVWPTESRDASICDTVRRSCMTTSCDAHPTSESTKAHRPHLPDRYVPGTARLWRTTARIVSWLTPKSAASERRLLVPCFTADGRFLLGGQLALAWSVICRTFGPTAHAARRDDRDIDRLCAGSVMTRWRH